MQLSFGEISNAMNVAIVTKSNAKFLIWSCKLGNQFYLLILKTKKKRILLPFLNNLIKYLAYCCLKCVSNIHGFLCSCEKRVYSRLHSHEVYSDWFSFSPWMLLALKWFPFFMTQFSSSVIKIITSILKYTSDFHYHTYSQRSKFWIWNQNPLF